MAKQHVTENIRIVKSTWFTNSTFVGCIGIVLCEDLKTGRQKAYIGTGNGNSEQFDADKIKNYGSTFPLEIAKKLIYGDFK